jgi:hypothetical protein
LNAAKLESILPVLHCAEQKKNVPAFLSTVVLSSSETREKYLQKTQKVAVTIFF